MNLLLLLILILMMLLGCALALVLFKDEIKVKLGLQPETAPSPQVQLQQLQALHCTYSADYTHVAEGVWSCLNDIQSRHGLDCPRTSIGVYCEKVPNRIAQRNGQIIFRYEIPWETVGLPGSKHMRPADLKQRLESIEDSLRQLLPLHLRGGYIFSAVSVWSVENNCVRVELHGVDRCSVVPTGGFSI